MKTMTRKNVLVCEDDPVQLKILTTLVRQAGYQSIEARTPSEAIVAARRCGVDAVLTDVQLQDGNAFDLIGDLRRFGVDAPVLMGSAFATDGMKDRARQAGAKFFFEKPFDLPKIREQVDRVLKIASNLSAIALIVESHAQVRADFEQTAIEAGFKVLAVENGVKALDLIQSGDLKIDLMLTDLHADGASGASLIRKALEVSPDLHVIMMSGDANRDEIRAGYEAGAASLIRKPIAAGRLETFLKESLKAARAAQKKSDLRIERAVRHAAQPATQRFVRSAKSFGRRTKGALALLAVAAAALFIGMGTAMATRNSYEAADRLEAQLERAIKGSEAVATMPASANRTESSVNRWQAAEQIRLMSEANTATRRYYEGHLEEMRWQNRHAAAQQPMTVAMPELRAAAKN
ncbi:MAG TPA: response regulator [Planctomycetota bacterium]|nr:response regulator [Planctomycetota bacterium]